MNHGQTLIAQSDNLKMKLKGFVSYYCAQRGKNKQYMISNNFKK